MERHILRPGPNDLGKRIDRILRVCFPSAPLRALFAALRKGEIRVNGKKAREDYRVAEGDEISVKKIAPFFPCETRSLTLSAAERSGKKTAVHAGNPLKKYIVYENEHFLALNKPWGMLSHGPGSLAEEVAAYLQPVLPPSLAFSPGPLHRLDRNTTGLIFFSKSLEGARAFSVALRAGSIRKTYYALVEGRLATRQTWTDILARDAKSRVSRAVPEEGEGKTARSEIRPLARGRSHTLCEVVIQTGRTHQIRAQAAAPCRALRTARTSSTPRRSSFRLISRWNFRLRHMLSALLCPQM